MTDFTAPMAQPRRFQTAARTTKTPRNDLVLLEIKADDCPQVLLRILGLVSRDGSIPATISATRSGERIDIAIELDGVSDSIGERIALKVAEFPAVRTVSLGGKAIS